MDLEKQAEDLKLDVNHQRLNDLKEKFRADDFGAESKIEDSFEDYFGKSNLLEIYPNYREKKSQRVSDKNLVKKIENGFKTIFKKIQLLRE